MVKEILDWLLSTKEFPIRWHCGQWDSFTGWTFIIADIAIFLAYFAIPCILTWFVLKQKLNIRFRMALVFFAMFIASCGLGHLIDALMFYWPAYRVLTLNHVVTALVSWATILVVLRRPQDLMEVYKELEAGDVKFKGLLEAAPDASVIVDQSGKIRLVNLPAEVMFGYLREEMVGQPIEMLIPERYRKQHETLRNEYLFTPEKRPMASNRELSGLKKSGDEFPIEVNLSPLATSEGLLVKSTIQDITLKKKLANDVLQLSQKLTGFLENAFEGFVSVDEHSHILQWNPQAEKIFGWTKEEAIGQSLEIIIPPGSYNKHREGVENFVKTGVEYVLNRRLEFTALHKDGREFPVEIIVTAFNTGNNFVFNGFIHDISERKQMENDILRSNKELDQFAYVISHDLKSPLRGIVNLVGWIEEDEQMTEKSKEYFRLLKNRVQRMNNLIHGVLEYSRIGRQDTELQLVSSNEIVRNVVDLLDVKQFRIEVQNDLPKVKANPVRLEQIFSNLIGNAIKHSSRNDGYVNISCQDDGKFYKFAVSDDGPGIDPRYHDKIFGMFQILKSKEEPDSTGIGLALVKKIVNSAGGKVWVESVSGSGSQFYFTWPKP